MSKVESASGPCAHPRASRPIIAPPRISRKLRARGRLPRVAHKIPPLRCPPLLFFPPSNKRHSRTTESPRVPTNQRGGEVKKGVPGEKGEGGASKGDV